MTWLTLRKRWVHYDGMERLFREFYLPAVAQRGPAPVTAEEGVRLMRIMDEAWRQIGPQTNAALVRTVPSDLFLERIRKTS